MRQSSPPQTWQLQNIGDNEVRLLGLHVVSPSEAYSVGTINNNSSTVLYRTIDGGATWQSFPIADQGGMTGFGLVRLRV
ncbi:MAG TPA: hypothetical protein VE867_05485 [Candidatus Binatia bacterium]|jgi:hypothetical protein|nr:hypothetical protein [Candidatus Binatia bacterium]